MADSGKVFTADESFSINFDCPMHRPVVKDAYLAWFDYPHYSSYRTNDFVIDADEFPIHKADYVAARQPQICVIVETEGFQEGHPFKIQIEQETEVVSINGTFNTKLDKLKLGEKNCQFDGQLSTVEGAAEGEIKEKIASFKKDCISFIFSKDRLLSTSEKKKLCNLPYGSRYANLYLIVDAAIHSEYKEIPLRIKYEGSKKDDQSALPNHFCYGDENWIRLKPIRGVVIHSMGEELTDGGITYSNFKDESDEEGNSFKVENEASKNLNAFFSKYGLSVHGMISQHGVFTKGTKEVYEKAAHAGVSYHKGYCDVNESYLGVELEVSDIDTIDDLWNKIDPQTVSTSPVETIETVATPDTPELETADAPSEVQVNDAASILEEVVDTASDSDTEEVYPKVQMDALVNKVAEWMCEYDISDDYLTGHDVISSKQYRSDAKRDPGNKFDWTKFRADVAAKINALKIEKEEPDL